MEAPNWDYPMSEDSCDPLSDKFSFRKFYHLINTNKHTGMPFMDGKYSNLIKFAESNGVKFLLSTPYNFELKEYSGMVALKNIEEMSSVLEIPSNLFISSHIVYHNIQLRQLFDAFPSLFSTDIKAAAEDLILIAFVFHEKSKIASFWKPVLDSWPSDSGLLFTWTKKELNELQDGALMWTSLIQAHIAHQYFPKFKEALGKCNDIFNTELITLPEFIRYWSLISSRTFSLNLI